MIITLTGADFSQNKIGTLNTWSVSYVRADGVTYSGDISVTRGSALNATAIIADGYELGSAGVTVTMGGVTQDSAYSINDNEITINIGSVTGNVVIKVSTVKTSTGGESGPPTFPVPPAVASNIVPACQPLYRWQQYTPGSRYPISYS